jgi:GNAT superfamily N-acetyltransferase
MKENFRLENVQIRTASLRDRDLLLKLVRAYYRYDHLPFNRKMIEEGLSELLKHEEYGKAWLIFCGRRCIGYLIFTFLFDLEFGGRQVGVTDLFIDAGYRRKGVGRRVLCELEQYCQKEGIKSIELQVIKENRKVVAFYERLGFHVHDRIPMSKRLDER